MEPSVQKVVARLDEARKVVEMEGVVTVAEKGDGDRREVQR